MDPIKEAFSKIKQDITFLREELNSLKFKLDNSNLPRNQHNYLNQQTNKPTNQQINHPLEGLSKPNMYISTGNEGVPTNKPTNQQTNKHELNSSHNLKNTLEKDPISEFKRANEIMSSLDLIKKEIRSKFKSLTNQEMLVFSTIYLLEQENKQVSYRIIANKLNLSEASIRDYINKLLKKGIPLTKLKQNNKKVILKISPDLHNVATLDTIIGLREI
jgi:biotin operon repressor